MNIITKEKRKEYEINCILSMLNELRRETSGNPKRLSLTDVAKRHETKDKYVHTMREMKIITSQRIDQGEKAFHMYLWNHAGPIETLAEHVYDKTKAESKLKEAKKTEDLKFQNKIGNKKLSKICHTSLRAPGTVLAFLDKVYKLCQTLPHEVYFHTKSEDDAENNVNQKILKYLEKSNIIKRDGLITIWNEDAPTIDMAMLVAEDLKQMPEPKMETNAKPRRESTRTIALKQSIKELLLEGAVENFKVNPLLRYKSANVKGALKGLFKFENNTYRMNPFSESIEEKVELLYQDIQKYQNKYLDRHKEKLSQNPKVQFTFEPEKKELRKVVNHEFSDLSEFLTTADNLKKSIMTSVTQYKDLLTKMNLTDKKLAEDLSKILA